MNDFFGGLFVLGLCFFLGRAIIGFFIDPTEDDVILELVKLGAIESTVVNGEIINTLVDQKYRPMLLLWDGKGLSFNGNIINH